MSGAHTIVVPDLGDFDDVEVIEIEISVGDTIEVDAALVTLETDKATMDVPSDVAGVVTELLVKTGDRVSQGSPVAVVELAEAAVAESSPAAAEAAQAAPVPSAEPVDTPVSVPDLGDFDDVEVIEVLVKVGDEVAAEDPLLTLETDKATMDVPSPMAGTVTAVTVASGQKVSKGDHIVTVKGVAQSTARPMRLQHPRPAPAKAAATPAPAAAAPSRALGDFATHRRKHVWHGTRRPVYAQFARELGVDLPRVQGSGVKGRITTDDIKRFVKSIMAGGAPGGQRAVAAGIAESRFRQVR